MNSFKTTIVHTVCAPLVLVAVLICSPNALADVSGSYEIDLSRLNSSGNIGSSENFMLNDTIDFVDTNDGFSDSYALHSGLVQLEMLCGNNILEWGEQCDDGNVESDDGCSWRCLFEEEEGDGRRDVQICGDGVRQGEEQCDDGNKKNGDGCNTSCSYEKEEEHEAPPEETPDPVLPFDAKDDFHGDPLPDLPESQPALTQKVVELAPALPSKLTVCEQRVRALEDELRICTEGELKSAPPVIDASKAETYWMPWNELKASLSGIDVSEESWIPWLFMLVLLIIALHERNRISQLENEIDQIEKRGKGKRGKK